MGSLPVSLLTSRFYCATPPHTPIKGAAHYVLIMVKIYTDIFLTHTTRHATVEVNRASQKDSSFPLEFQMLLTVFNALTLIFRIHNKNTNS